MAMRLTGKGCLISTSSQKLDDESSTHLYCVSRLKGLRCPREGKAGAKPFELGPECFKAVKGAGDRKHNRQH